MEKLGVQLRHASRIKAGDSNGKSDPYVVFFWKGTDPKSGKKSSVVKETLEPVWNESFQMAYDKDVHDTLVAQVWDNDTVGKDFLGEAEISVDVMTSSTGSYSLGPREGQSDSGITGTLDVAFDLPPSLRSQSGVVGLLKMMGAGGGKGSAILLSTQVNTLDERLAGYPTVELLSKKTGLSKGQLALYTIIFLFLFIMFGFGAGALCNLIGVIYPIFKSFKAIRTEDTEDDSQWLTYWIVYGFFSVVEAFTDRLLFWIPFYYVIKVLFLVWCMHPVTLGANQIYARLIEPTLSSWDKRVVQIKKSVSGSFPSDKKT